jgi:pilus assembly protein CpaB
MDRRFLTVLGVSLVFALVVSSVFYQMASRAGSSKKQDVSDLKDVVVAGRAMSPGITVSAEDLKVVKTPAAQVPKGSFSKAEDVLGRPVISPILLEEPILDGRLAQRGAGVGVAPSIPPGMRAVTVRINDIVGVAGWMQPGMRVDLLITGDPPGRGTRITKTVLQNIHVLSVGAAMQVDPKGQPVNAPNVTLLVTPQQAEAITLAANGGNIMMVLRNGTDQEIAKTEGVNLHSLYGIPMKDIPGAGRNRGNGEPYVEDSGDRPVRAARARVPQTAAEAPAPPPPPPPVPDQIITIRGTDKKLETLPSGPRQN